MKNIGKTLGILSLVFGIVSFALFPFSFFDIDLYFKLLLSIITAGLVVAGIVCGAIGIAKDDSKGLAIAGLIVSSIAIITLIPQFYFLIFGNRLFGA